MAQHDPAEGMARALVLALMPALTTALMAGKVYQRAADELLAIALPIWTAQHGEAVADRAVVNLRRINCATVLTPYGRELWMREYPLEGIPKWPPPEGMGEPPRPARLVWRRLLARLGIFSGVRN